MEHLIHIVWAMESPSGMNVTDLRIEKTQLALFAALDDLLSEKPFSEITVSDLSRQAGIGRQTFYRHFDSIGAMLDMRFQKGKEEQLAIARQSLEDREDWELAIHRFAFERIAAEPHIARTILCGEAGPNALTNFRDQIIALHEIAPHNRFQATKPELQRFVAPFQSGAIVAVLLEWIDAGCTPDADTMSQFMVDAGVMS